MSKQLSLLDADNRLGERSVDGDSLGHLRQWWILSGSDRILERSDRRSRGANGGCQTQRHCPFWTCLDSNKH